MVPCLGLLTALEDILGSLGPTVNQVTTDLPALAASASASASASAASAALEQAFQQSTLTPLLPFPLPGSCSGPGAAAGQGGLQRSAAGGPRHSVRAGAGQGEAVRPDGGQAAGGEQQIPLYLPRPYPLSQCLSC